MKKIFLIILLQSIISNNLILAHCQIPCGIYNDSARIVMIKENFQTIKKAMNEIHTLSNKKDSLSKNQINRWIATKERHADNIQNIISEYFLTQRIKESDEDYIKKTTVLQKLLVNSMHCKQTLDLNNVNKGIILIDSFSKLYFNEHDLKHLLKSVSN